MEVVEQVHMIEQAIYSFRVRDVEMVVLVGTSR